MYVFESDRRTLIPIKDSFKTRKNIMLKIKKVKKPFTRSPADKYDDVAVSVVHVKVEY